MLRLIEWWMDTRGVARFARAMRRRMRNTRRSGRGGWWHPAWEADPLWLRERIIENNALADFVDVATYAMIGWHRITDRIEPGVRKAGKR